MKNFRKAQCLACMFTLCFLQPTISILGKEKPVEICETDIYQQISDNHQYLISLPDSNLSSKTIWVDMSHFTVSIDGVMNPDESGNYEYIVDLKPVNGLYPDFYKVISTGEIKDPSQPIKINALTQGFETLELFYKSSSSLDTDGFSHIWVSFIANDVKLNGLEQPVLESVVSEECERATLSVPQEEGADYQWQYQILSWNRIERDQPVPDIYFVIWQCSTGFNDIKGANSNTYSATGIESQNVSTIESVAYRCKIIKDGKTYYSKILPFLAENDWLNKSWTIQVSADQIARALLNSYTWTDQHINVAKTLNIQPKYLSEYPRNQQRGAINYEGYGKAPGIHFRSLDSKNPEMFDYTKPAELSDLLIPGTHKLQCIVSSTSVYGYLEHEVTVEVLPETNNFQDVQNGVWYADSVQKANKLGLIKGSNGLFKPDENLKRGDLALILYRLAGEPEVGPSTFSDVKDGQYYAKAIQWARDREVCYGYASPGVAAEEFKPEQPVSREQLITMLARYYNKIQNHTVEAAADLSIYPDDGQVSDFARIPMSWGINKKLLNGKLIDNVYYLSPDSNTTRAEAAKILAAFFNVIKGA